MKKKRRKDYAKQQYEVYLNTTLTEVKAAGIHLVGDCQGVGNLRTVIWRAWDVAMKI